MNKKLNKPQKGIEGTTCFSEHNRYQIPCPKSSCRYWHENTDYQNCMVIAANDGPKTLQQIGDIFEVTRMRICQVEKLIFKKLFPAIDSLKPPNSSRQIK
jgi:hypothetical protein